MRTPIIFSALLALLLCGCANGKLNKLAVCDCAYKAYAVYEATLAAGRVPSSDEVAAAKVAAAVIAVYCGPATKSIVVTRSLIVDTNGVLVLP